MARATPGVITGALLAVTVIGLTLAQARGRMIKHTIKVRTDGRMIKHTIK